MIRAPNPFLRPAFCDIKMTNAWKIRWQEPVLIKRFINFLLPALVRVVYCLSLLVPVKVFIGIFLA